MKKSDLSKLVERKKILKESLDIIKESYKSMDEVGGFDNPDLMAQYHGNYIDELISTFFTYDALSNDLYEGLSKILDNKEKSRSKILVDKYVSFMDEYHSFIDQMVERYKTMPEKSKYSDIPGLNKPGFSLNEDEDNLN